MQFTNLNIFSFLIFIIFLWIIAFLAYQKYFLQKEFNKKFDLIASKNNFYLKYIFLILSFFVILFGIFWIKYWEQKNISANKWIDMMFVLDVSKSMNVADIRDSNYSYTRLQVAKKAIWDYVAKHPENRYWLVIFAWDAISTIPLTTDSNLFLTMLSGVDYRNLTVQWSDFEKALRLWVNRFIWDKNRSKALVFISDWWDYWDNTNIDISDKKNIAFSVVWVWTEKWWKIILGQDAFWRMKYQRYKWQYVISKLNLNNLKEIANKLDANFIKLNEVSDIFALEKQFSSLEKKAYKKLNSWNLADFSRNLTIFSFILFLIFLGIYIFEDKLNFNKKNNE